MRKEGHQSSGVQWSRLSRNARVLVLDTSVLMYDPNAVETFEDNWVVLGIRSFEELDKFKESDAQRKSLAARSASRVLADYESKGNLKNGVPMGKGLLIVDDDGEDWDLPESIKKHPDLNAPIAIAKGLKEKVKSLPYSGNKPRVAIVSKNINLRLKANACGIAAEDYEHDRDIFSMKDLYTGMVQIDLKDEEQALPFMYDVCEGGDLTIKQLSKSLYGKQLLSNQFVRLITGKDQVAYGIYKAEQEIIHLFKPQDKKRAKIVPLNPEQACADELLYDREVVLVTLVGEAGTGKTLLSLNAGLDQVWMGMYEKMIVFRPTIEVGREMGFLKGDLSEKMAPWRAPIEEAVKRIYSLRHKNEDSREALTKMMADGQIEIRPINYARGDSIHNAFVIVEEAQNLKPSEIKLIVTRVAEGSKIVLNGDLTQVDDPFLDFRSSGLTRVVERFKGLKLGKDGTAGHITLITSERSEVAKIAARILS